MTINSTPEILVTADPVMATEPAREIGRQMVGVANVRTLIVALVAFLAVVGVRLPDGFSDAAVDIVTGAAPFAAIAWAWWQMRQNAKVQAEQTRDAVFSPATVAGMVAESQGGAETVEAVVVPAPVRFPKTAMDPDGDGVVDL
jgi:hypothetical protein